MKKNIMLFFQKLSRAFLMPIALLSVASLLLGVASVFLWHQQLQDMFPIIKAWPIQYIAQLLNTGASAIMDNLGFLFAISLAFSLAEEDKEYSAFGAVVGYLTFNMSMAVLFTVFPDKKELFPANAFGLVLGIETLKTGVLGGIIVGLISANIHKWAKNVKLPIGLAFFGGLRFVPIANVLIFLVIGQIFPFIWIPLSNGIYLAAEGIANTGIFATFFYGFGERLLIPTGLHHIWNTVIRDTAISGVFTFPDGTIVEGGRPAFNEFLRIGQAPDLGLVEMVKYLRGGQLPMTMFVLPAMGIAMYKTALDKNKARIKPLIYAGILTSLIAGVTEPLEFAFLFASPLLYLIYSVFVGISFIVVNLLGNTFGGTEPNVIGLILYGFLQPTATWIIPVLVGVIMSIGAYPFTKWWILKFNIKTPGRGGEDEVDILDLVKSTSTDPAVLKAEAIIMGLGGQENIEVVDCCFTRLRVTLKNSEAADDQILNATGCMGIVRVDANNIQVIYGPTVNIIKDSVKKQLVKVRSEK